jgi:hypothetical protein
MPLPGAMFGDDRDKNFRTAPRWATIEPEQVRASTGSWAGAIACQQLAL